MHLEHFTFFFQKILIFARMAAYTNSNVLKRRDGTWPIPCITGCSVTAKTSGKTAATWTILFLARKNGIRVNDDKTTGKKELMREMAEMPFFYFGSFFCCCQISASLQNRCFGRTRNTNLAAGRKDQAPGFYSPKVPYQAGPPYYVFFLHTLHKKGPAFRLTAAGRRNPFLLSPRAEACLFPAHTRFGQEENQQKRASKRPALTPPFSKVYACRLLFGNRQGGSLPFGIPSPASGLVCAKTSAIYPKPMQEPAAQTPNFQLPHSSETLAGTAQRSASSGQLKRGPFFAR